MTVKGFPVINPDIANASTPVINSPQRLLFIGQKVAGGTATAGELNTEIGNDNSWDTLFGARSMLADMVRRARQVTNLVQNNIRIDAIALDDAGAGVAATGTVAFTGTTAATSGTITIVIGSSQNYTISVPVVLGDDPTDVGDALVAAIAANTQAPFTAVNTTGTVVITYSHKGTVGNEATLRLFGGATTIAGITTAITGFASGTTDPTLTSVLDVVGNNRYQGIVYPSQYGFDFGTDFLDPRFNFNNRILDGRAVLAETDTLANLKTTGNAENSQSLVVFGNKLISETLWKGSVVTEFNYVIAALIATVRAVRVETGSQLNQLVVGQFDSDKRGGVYNNSLPYANTAIPYVTVIDETKYWTSSEMSEINTTGISVLDNNSSLTNVLLNETYTTYKTDGPGNADLSFRYLNYVDTITAIREYRFNNMKKDFAQYRLDDDAELQVRNAFIKYFDVLRSENYRLLRSGQESKNYYINNLTVAVDFQTGLVTVVSKDPIIVQLRQINATFKVVFDITTGQPVASETEEVEV